MAFKRLFIDDCQVLNKRELTRTFHSATKHPINPVLAPERAWEIETGREGVACPMVLAEMSPSGATEYKMWYWSSVGGLRDLYATSRDGVSWERPDLGIVEFRGSLENNLVETPGRIGPGAVFASPDSATLEGADTLYRTVSWIPSATVSQRYLPIFSGDGLHWRTAEDADAEPGISGPGIGDTGTFLLADESFPMTREDVPGRYVAFPRLGVQMGKWRRRAVGMTACNATPHGMRLMLDWPHPNLVLAPDFLDDEMAHERLSMAYRDGVTHFDDPNEHHCEFYAMQAWPVADVFLGVVYVFDISMNMDRRGAWNHHGIIETQLVYSRDLVHWERLGKRQPWIARGQVGDFDDSMVHFCSVPVPVGDRMYIYYTGTSMPHPTSNMEIVSRKGREALAGKRPPLQAIGCATFRRDGYVSVDAGQTEGSLTTKPFVLTGDQVRVNVNAAGGELLVSLCDDLGMRRAGLESEMIQTDDVAAAVVFKNRPLTDLIGERMTLEFRIRNAQLFSYEVV